MKDNGKTMKTMKIFVVTRKETASYYTLIEAKNATEAKQYAESGFLNEDSWRSNQDFDAKITSVKIADEDELVGRIIERTDKTDYEYHDKDSDYDMGVIK